MRKRKLATAHLFGLALALAGLTSAAIAQSAAPRQNGKIAFTSDRDGNLEIYVMNADGTNHVRLTNNSVLDNSPTWSPDGTKIAFVSQRPSGAFAIFQMNADGTNKTEITPINFDPMRDIFASMSWSPDGSRIVFQERTDPSRYPSDIFIVNIDGSNRHVLVNGPEDDIQPVWSPDGSRILFSKLVHPCSRLFTIKPDGTDLRALAHSSDRGCDYGPSWSPTGDKIAFSIWGYLDFETIVIANADGSGRYWLNNNTFETYIGDSVKPQWSPDGSKIIFTVFLDDVEIFVMNVDRSGLTRLTDTPGTNFNPSWQLLPSTTPNQIDDPAFFVRQHYLDFLGREPDPPGLAFWTNEITSCGADAGCVEAKRVHVSAAFFLSIEFQQTGFYAIRVQRAAFGRKSADSSRVTRAAFLPDAQALGANIVVGQGDWQGQLDENKQAYAERVVASAEFTSRYSSSLTAAEYVAALYASAGVTPTQAETDEAVAAFGAGGAAGRAAVLRKVAESGSLTSAELNPAFVLMEYFGYLRRDPDQEGYDFWLAKLNQFNGDFVRAEMVKAFISSTEYRRGFGQP